AKALATEHPGLADVFDSISEGIAVEGMESLAPVLAEGMGLLVDGLDPRTCVLVVDPERVRRRSHELLETSQEVLAASWANAAAGNQTPIDLADASYRSWAEVSDAARARGLMWWGVGPFGAGDNEADQTLSTDLHNATEYRGDTDRALADIRDRLAEGWTV